MPVFHQTPVRAMRNLLCASVAAVALHACATAPAPLTASDLLTAPYSLRGGEAFDVDRMFAALPDWVQVEHGGASFDAALGAMVVSDVRFVFDASSGAGIHAERALIWGGDPAAMEAVFSGEASLSDMALLFDRMTLENVASEGLQWEAGAQSASLAIDKVVLDGLAARSYALTAKPGAPQGTSVLRHIGAVMGAFAYDGAAYSGFSFTLANSRGDTVELDLQEAFARDYRAGAVAYQSASGMRMAIQSLGVDPLVEVAGEEKTEKADPGNPYAKIMNKPPADMAREIVTRPAEFLAAATGAGILEYQVDMTDARNVDLSKALAWLAKWELPPITETELMDFGQQTMTGYREIWNGQPYYTVDRVDVSAADFYWLVPSQYEVAYKGFTFDTTVMMEQMRNNMGPGMATEAAPQLAQVTQALSALGFERIAGDMAFAWGWNGETGDASVKATSDIIDNFSNNVGFNIGGPSLAEWDVMARDDTLAKDAVGGMTLQDFSFSFTDLGLVDRAFEFAAAQNGAGSGAELRQAISGAVRLSGMQAAEMNPRLPAYAGAFADFLDNGGAISVVAAPAEPVTFEAVQTAAQVAPQTLPDLLNVSVTHTEE